MADFIVTELNIYASFPVYNKSIGFDKDNTTFS